MSGDDFSRTLTAARRGDGAAWRSLFGLVSGRVVGFLVARGCPDPEDVASEVFADLVGSIRRFRGDRAAFLSWTMTIAHRRMVDAWRAAARRPAFGDTAEMADLADSGDVAEDVLGLVAAEEARCLLSRLTPDQADVLLLRIYGEMTLPEISQHLGKPLTAVTSLQHRGLDALRRLLDEPTTGSRLSGSGHAG